MSHHHHEAGDTASWRLFLTMLLNFVITAVEIIGGIMSGSLSLISDALHNFSDGIAIIISYIAVRLNRRPKTAQYTFGLKRAEILAAIINSSALIIISFFLLKEAYERFTHPSSVSGGLMMGVAGIGLIANVAGTLLLRKGAKSSMNLRSVYLHLLSDAASSVAVILGGAAIYFYEIYWLDPVLTVLIALYILKESMQINKEALQVMLMASPEGISIEALSTTIKEIPGVNNVHHIHLWRLDEHDIHFEAHVEVDDMPVSAAEEILQKIQKRLLEKFNINHVTVQFEIDRCQEKTLVAH
ncbi:cation transporter [candidate division KSB1 bacterium]|nr:MAG: cation transporter [candidate division KSB1 bacterium]